MSDGLNDNGPYCEPDEYMSGKLIQKKECIGGGPQMSREEFLAFKEQARIDVEQIKDTNPKDAVGTKKVPYSCVSAAVMAELALAMLEGGRKYGRHNYRVSGIRASVYYDAALRHLTKWWEGEDIDPDSGLSHIIKAFASIMVLRDAQICGMWTDDRPPKIPDGFIENLNTAAAEIIEKYPDAKDPFTQKMQEEKL